jgi:hypothetical protein
MAARGLRNNNPFNIRLTKIGWIGKVPNAQNTDGAFEQFKEMEYGIRAGMVNMRTHINRGDDTVAKLIKRHAPPSDNNPTQSFVEYVLRKSGFGRDEKINVKDYRFVKLAQAVIQFENGTSFDINTIRNVHAKYIA